MLLALVAMLVLSAFCETAASADGLPNVMLWAWQRPEDLSAIDPKTTGVAYLAANVVLAGSDVRISPRVQPLKAAAGTKMIAVLRMDSSRTEPPVLTDAVATAAARKIYSFGLVPRSAGLQLDFDALETERPFYERLVREVRRLLPEDKMLSITALASWCLFDDWLSGLPVDESVPMMFSLGKDRRKVLLHFKLGKEFIEQRCCRSLGISLEDSEVNRLMIPVLRKRKMATRTYVFTRTAWTREKLRAVHSLLLKP
jgi:hypothetical protein